MPNGASCWSSSARSSDSASPWATASIRTSGTRSSGESTSAACSRNAARKASTSERGDRQARRRLVAAVAEQVPGARVQAAEQVEGADRAARSRCPPRRRARSGSPGGGGARRSARRRSRSRPGCQPSAASTSARPSGCSATSASASKRIRVSTSRRSALTRSSSCGDGLGALAVLGQQQLEPGVGAVQAPGGVQPRAEPEADRGLVEPARVHARDVHQRAQPDLARARQRPQALRGRAGGSRPAAARRRRRWPARPGPGPRRPAPGPPPRRPAAPARACGRRPPRTGPAHG